MAATYLYRSIGFLEELALYGDDEVQQDLHEIITLIGVKGEKILIRSALRNNMAFNPTYLKNTY